MEILEIEDKELFLKYAIPCGQVLVRRGTLDGAVLQELNRRMVDGSAIKGDIGKYFPVAAKMTSIIATEMGKEMVDSEVIRRYFLSEHDKAVKWRASIFPDIPVDECMIQPGRVIKTTGDNIIINTPNGEKLFRKDFIPEARRGDMVTLHYDFASEITDRDSFRKLVRMRK